MTSAHPACASRDASGLTSSQGGVVSRVEARAGLVPASVFKTDDALREQRHAWPLGPTRTLLQSYTLVPEPPVTEKAQRYWDANNAILYGATEEDYTLGESIQRGLASGANTELTFGAFEHALTHFHAQVTELATSHHQQQ